MPQQYPFSAIVGCEADHLDPMGLALILSTTISPEIGGVLIRGEKGTAKSTAVRALAAVLPPVAVYEGDRFSIDPDDPSAVSLDLPDRRRRRPRHVASGAARRAARRRDRGPRPGFPPPRKCPVRGQGRRSSPACSPAPTAASSTSTRSTCSTTTWSTCS
jgi:hypothetical protein